MLDLKTIRVHGDMTKGGIDMSKKEKFFNNENNEIKSEVIDVDYDVVESGIEQFEHEQIIGIVSNCKRLNIRRNPNIKADIVCDVP